MPRSGETTITPTILTMGDLLVEVMGKELDQPLSSAADLVGPFPSGASAIFIDAAARLGGSESLTSSRK